MRTPRTPIEGLTHWVRVLAGGAAIATLSLVAMSLVIFRIEQSRDREREQERVQRTIEACFQYNEDQTRAREFHMEQIPALAEFFFDADQAELDRIEASVGRQLYRQFVIDQFPYRQCSERCTEAYLDPAIKECLPASNQQGDP